MLIQQVFWMPFGIFSNGVGIHSISISCAPYPKLLFNKLLAFFKCFEIQNCNKVDIGRILFIGYKAPIYPLDEIWCDLRLKIIQKSAIIFKNAMH